MATELHDEWTRVRRKPRRNAQRRTVPPQSPSYMSTGAAPSLGNSAMARLSVSDIQRDHNRHMAQWQESTCRRRLIDLLSARLTTTSWGSRPNVSRAVCLGIGSFDPEDGAWEVKRRAHIQLAAFLTIVTTLRDYQGRHDGQDESQSQNEHQQKPQPIRCFFQEPMFTPSDKDFIRALGHEFEVVESPRGFELVDNNTLVFGVHLYRDIYSRAIAGCAPAIFVGTGLNVWEEYHGSDGLNWARMEELDRQCDRASFPEDEGFTTFSSTSIHWRRPDDA